MILIVDDDAAVRASLSLLLKSAGYACMAVDSPDKAIETVRRDRPAAVLLDMNFTCMTTGDEGLIALKQIKLFAPDTPVILITAWGSIDLAVEGMRAGAFDFITKPWDNRRLLSSVATAIEMNGCAVEDEKADFNMGPIIGHDPELMKVLKVVERVAPTEASVLITGESGTGKELIAEAIHRNSPRRDGPFVKVNLGGMPPQLFESEMFGHKKGAFTGAVSDRKGRFEMADGGTIFLDEIGELDLSCQVKLLRVLQEHTFEPLGTSRPVKVDVRVVCATNADLKRMIAEKSFREDLYYRISVVNVTLPPLRSRGNDIKLLAEMFLAEACRDNGLHEAVLSQDAADYLRTLPLPGNVRELKNIMERVALMSGSELITADDLRASGVSAELPADGTRIDDLERTYIRQALDRHSGNVSRAAKELGLSRGALYRRMEKYGLK